MSIATLLSQHHQVTAVDIVPEKVELINNRKSPIQDDYMLQALEMFSDDFMSDGNLDGAEIRKAAEAMKSKAEDIAKGKRDYMTYVLFLKR